MIVRRMIIVAAAGALSGAWGESRAQAPTRVLRIGAMSPAVGFDHPDMAFVWDPFRQELQRLGWSEGRNIVFEHRPAEGDDARWPQLVRELVELPVDLILVGAGTGALAVKAGTRTIPVVFAAVPDPVRQGIVASLARPGGNLTGVGSMSLELGSKRLELMKEAFPRVATVAQLPYANEATDEVHRAANQELLRAGRKLGLQVLQADVRDVSDLERAIAALPQADAWYVQDDILYHKHWRVVLELLTAQRKPAIYPQTYLAQVGGLMSYGVDLPDQYRRAAVFVDKILRGAKPGELPVELPRRFELAFNVKTAKTFGLAIPQRVLARADRVYE